MKRITRPACALAAILSAGMSGIWAQENGGLANRKSEQLGEVNFLVSCDEAAQKEFNHQAHQAHQDLGGLGELGGFQIFQRAARARSSGGPRCLRTYSKKRKARVERAVPVGRLRGNRGVLDSAWLVS